MMAPDDSQKIRLFIEEAKAKTGKDDTGLARGAEVAPSTVTRFMNGQVKHMPSMRTLIKISKFSGVSLPPITEELKILPKEARISAVMAVAEALEVDLDVVPFLDDQLKGRRSATEWIDVIRRLPPVLEDKAFDFLRGMADAGGPTKNSSGPRKSPGRVRRQG